MSKNLKNQLFLEIMIFFSKIELNLFNVRY